MFLRIFQQRRLSAYYSDAFDRIGAICLLTRIIKERGKNMLTYLINVTDDMLALSLVIGMIMAFLDTYCRDSGKITGRIGLAIGIVAAGVRAYFTNTRRIKDGWKVGTYGYGISLGLLLLTVIALAVFGYFLMRKKNDSKMKTAANWVISVCFALFMAACLYCSLPNVLTYPFKFDTGGNGIISSDFFLRLGGYLLGIIVCAVSGIGVYKLYICSAQKDIRSVPFTAMCIGIILYGVFYSGKLLAVLTTRKIIDDVNMFSFAAQSNNMAHFYTYGLFILALIVGIVFFVKSITKKEPYSTKAQHRKQRALWRSGKRYSLTLVFCFIAGILCSTLFVEMNKVVIREAPVEDPVIIKDANGGDAQLQVPIEMVSDGHLHRFGYKTDEGNLVRFIVVLKQENTSNYGVGLDACEICGEAGYYENNAGQIVCKKCNVIMNRTTIGMKGGCNPIIIDYDMDENAITVPVSEMVKNQKIFKG